MTASKIPRKYRDLVDFQTFPLTNGQGLVYDAASGLLSGGRH